MTHGVQVVALYLKGYTFTQIRQRIRPSLCAIANYLVTFALVMAHTRAGQPVEEIAFLMQISPALVRQYQALYEQYNLPEYQQRLDEIIAPVKARGFGPSQLEENLEPLLAQKKGGCG